MSIQQMPSPRRTASPRSRLASDREESSHQRSNTSLEEKMLRAANLVAEDATRQSSPRALAKTCGLIGTPDSGSTSAPYTDEGEGYVLIRKAFSDAFHDLIQQMPWSKQSTVEDLWAVFADYLDRVHARLDVAFNDSTVYIAYTAELEREVRLWKARYKELLHVKQQLEELQQGDAKQAVEAKADVPTEEAESEKGPVSVPQPAEDRSVLGLVQHQAPLTPCGGEATGPISTAVLSRSQRSAALVRLATKGRLVDTSLSQMMNLGLAGPGVDAQDTSEAAHVTPQQSSAWAQARAEAAQQGLFQDERERAQARQQSIMAQLQEQLVGMRARTASIDSPVRMADADSGAADSAAADSASSPSQQSSDLLSASHLAMQGTPSQGPAYLGSAPARLAAEPGLEGEIQRGAQLSAHSMRGATRRPRSIAQKAGMNAWSRHSHRNGRQVVSEQKGPGPEDMHLTSASSGPLAQGLAAAAAHRLSFVEGRQSSSRKPRHMLLSCSVDTVLGDVFAASTSAGSEGIMAQQPQGYADIRRQGSSMHMAACSTVRLSQTEEERQSAARLLVHPEQIALALAEQPSAQPLVSCDILQLPLASSTEGCHMSRPAGTAQRGAADWTCANMALSLPAEPHRQPNQMLFSPGGALSPMQHARASIQQWGRLRGSPSPTPQPESMVICGPTWSFPVENLSPVASARGREAHSLPPKHLPTALTPQAGSGGVSLQSLSEGKGEPRAGLQPEDRSISFRCRQVTASLPDMAALAAAIRGEPKPQQQLLPDLAIAERAQTLEELQAAAEQVSSSCAPPYHSSAQSAAWPLKKKEGAWDRIHQSTKSVRPDRWHVNEAAEILDSVELPADQLPAALTVQPKQPALELAAEAALAALAQEAAPLARSEGTTAKPAAEGASSRLQDSKQEGAYSADSTTQRGQLEPDPAAAAAVPKAAGKRPGMAQKLLAKANCFAAAFTSSPAKGILSIEQLPSEAKVLPNAVPKAAAAAAAVSTAPHEAAKAASAPTGGGAAVSTAPHEAAKAASASTGDSEASQVFTETPAAAAKTGSPCVKGRAAAGSPARLEQAERSPAAQAPQMEAALTVGIPEGQSRAASRSPAKGGATCEAAQKSSSSNASICSALLLSEKGSPQKSSPSSMSSHKTPASVTSGGTIVSAGPVLIITPSPVSTESRMVAESPQGEVSTASPERAAVALTMPQAAFPTSKQGSACSAAAESAAAQAASVHSAAMSPAPKGSPAGALDTPVTPNSAAVIGNSDSLVPGEMKSPENSSITSEQAMQTPQEKGSPSKSPWGLQKSPSYDIHVACQSSRVIVASAAVHPCAASQQAQPAGATKAPAWPDMAVAESPKSKSGALEEQTQKTVTCSPAVADKAVQLAQDSSPDKTAAVDPLLKYKASLLSARKAAQDAAEMMASLPPSPVQSSPRTLASPAPPPRQSSMGTAGSRAPSPRQPGTGTARREAAADESRSVSDIVFSSDSDSHADSDADSEDEMYTAHSEFHMGYGAANSFMGLKDGALAAQVQETISEDAGGLLQTASDEGLTGSLTSAEMEVTRAQVTTSSAMCAADSAAGTTDDRELDVMLAGVLGSGQARSQDAAQTVTPDTDTTAQAKQVRPQADDRELDAMLAKVLGSASGQASACSVQEAVPAVTAADTNIVAQAQRTHSQTDDMELNAMLAGVLGSGQAGVQAALPAVTAADTLSAAQAQQVQPQTESKADADAAEGAAAEKGAFHLPDSLFESPLAAAGEGQSSNPFGTQKADSDNEDGGTFVKQPAQKNRKARRAGRR